MNAEVEIDEKHKMTSGHNAFVVEHKFSIDLIYSFEFTVTTYFLDLLLNNKQYTNILNAIIFVIFTFLNFECKN